MGHGRGCCCETGVRPSFESNSLQGSEFRRCSMALRLAEERWNENHSKLLTPAQELCRNAQPQLWRGGTEPALFLCLLHQSNRDEEERRGREERETQEREGGRGGKEKIVRAALWHENERLLFYTEVNLKCLCFILGQYYWLYWAAGRKDKPKRVLKKYHSTWHIFPLNYLWFHEMCFLNQLRVKMLVLSGCAAQSLIRTWRPASPDKRLFNHWLMNPFP